MRYFAIALLAIGMAACTNDSTSPNGSVRGTYNLRTIDGSQLPIPLNNGCVIQSDQMIIDANGNYEEDYFYTDPACNQQDLGTYSANNNTVDFFSENGFGEFTGSVSGNVLTIITAGNPGDTWVYARQ